MPTPTHRSSLRARALLAVLVTALLGPRGAGAAELKVLMLGLGEGRVTSDALHPGIDCGADCTEAFGNVSVTLTASPASAETTFAGWSAPCTGTGPCTVNLATAAAVTATFRPTATIAGIAEADIHPGGIRAYLEDPANAFVNSPARFVAALPPKYRQNWIVMTRSESLQTGTARYPRLLLPSQDARNVFTVGTARHASYPGAHPNAIEYMQWDATQKNFRFHEIVLATIPGMGDTVTRSDGTTGPRYPERVRGVSQDDPKCFACHSTRNVPSLDRSVFPPVPGPYPGTDGVTPGTVASKGKPNWDAYDSWAGMLPFNRDRIYQGSLEAKAFRHLFNLWNWRDVAGSEVVRPLLEVLDLQPPYVGSSSPHRILRNVGSVDDDAHIVFGFDGLASPATTSRSVSYAFGRPSTGARSVPQGGPYVTLRHSDPNPTPGTLNDSYAAPVQDEGRAVQLFDLLGGLDGTLNAERIADELVDHHHATGGSPIDVRAAALAIVQGNCLVINEGTRRIDRVSSSDPALTFDQAFFTTRNNGLDVVGIRNDTYARLGGADPVVRAVSLPRRKAELAVFNLDRTGDRYLYADEDGMFAAYGGVATPTTDQLRDEIFRRPLEAGMMQGDATEMGGIYVDREDYSYNTDRVAMLRYLLEPLGVSVDKWAMGVRGRSRTYTFADVFANYTPTLIAVLTRDLRGASAASSTALYDCSELINAMNAAFTPTPNPTSYLPPASGAGAVPTYTDVQRIFNKSCIECHGGLGYPPYGTGYLDFSEDETPNLVVPTSTSRRLVRSHARALSVTTSSADATNQLWTMINDPSEDCSDSSVGMMPCGGPPLSAADIATLRRWIEGPPSRPDTVGDPHLTTVDGIHYDFQSAGEFVLLRDEFMEIQARQTPVSTAGPLGANAYTGLRSCVSVNTGVAIRMGLHRVTLLPGLDGTPSPEGLTLRVDGEVVELDERGVLFEEGGRIRPTTAPGGVQIEAPGGTVVVLTPGLWEHYQLWHLDISIQHPRAIDGVLGVVPAGSWLPGLPDGRQVGPLPKEDLHQRYVDLYETFESAWRVTDATTLFDYGPGLSTTSYTLDGWPEENPQACKAPRMPGGPSIEELPKGVDREVAMRACADVAVGHRRDNCVVDVAATGDLGFATTYLAAERIDHNTGPSPAELVFPAHNAANLDASQPIRFTWNIATDKDADDVVYRHCVWPQAEAPSFLQCDATPLEFGTGERGLLCALAAIGIALGLLGWYASRGGDRRVVLFGLALTLVLAVFLVPRLQRSAVEGPSKLIGDLEPGKTYLWRVVSEDGEGGTTVSATRRFTTRK